MTNHTLPHIEALLDAFTAIPFNRLLGLKLETLTSDYVALRFDMHNDLIGNFLKGILHGGVISSVLDMAGGMIVMASIIAQEQNTAIEELTTLVSQCSTIDLHIDYIRPGKGQFFIAKAYLIKFGRKISFTRMELINENEVLIATANGTYLRKH